MKSKEKGNNLYAAIGELLNHPFNIVNSVARKNIVQNTEDQIAGSSQSWQSLHQQQLLGNHSVRNEIGKNMESGHFLQTYRTKRIKNCNSASVNQWLGLTKSDIKYTVDHLQMNPRSLPQQFITTEIITKMKYPNCLVQHLQCVMITATQIFLILPNYSIAFHNQFQKI